MIAKLLLFKIGWLAVVLSAAHSMSIIGVLAAIAIVGYHIATSNAVRRDAELVIVALVIGAAWETLVAQTGLLRYPETSGVIAPYWIVVMWGLFSTIVREPLAFLQRHWSLPILAGAAGGAGAFYGGAGLGAVEIDSVTTYAVIALGWAVWLPLLMALAKRPLVKNQPFGTIS